MQLNIFPIAYSGISEDDLAQFTTTTNLPLRCSDPSYIEYTASSVFRTTFAFSDVSDLFIVQEGNKFSAGLSNTPWTIELILNELASYYKYKHWGVPIGNYIDFTANNSRILDHTVKTFGNDNYLLCLSSGIPVLIVYDKFTSLLTYNVQIYKLYSTTVDHVQWIRTPEGIDKILLRKGNSLYYITISNTSGAYPIINTPIDVTPIAILPQGMNADVFTRFSKTVYYYHGNTLCCFTSYQQGTDKLSKFYHWDNGTSKFLLDLSLPIASSYSFYSEFNNAINFPFKDSQFIGDYKWYLVTPMSDLYTFFQYNDSRILYDYELYPEGGQQMGAHLVDIYQDTSYVYFIYVLILGTGQSIKLAYHKYEQPTVTTAIFNINNEIPFSAITGYLSIEGDLFYPDFQWEVSSKNRFTIYTGQPEILLTEPSIVNLRVTPSMPQQITAINFVPLPNDAITYSIIDDRHTDFTIPYYLLSTYNKVDVSVRTTDVAPFILISVGDLNIRHCRNNANVLCIQDRIEFKTDNCNETCPLFDKNYLIFDIVKDGTDITGEITDERDVFPDYQDIANLDIRLFF